MKVGEHEKTDKPKPCMCDSPVAYMVTYERPGLLSLAVDSFLETTRGQVDLNVLDDGSMSADKSEELMRVARRGIYVRRLEHRGFARMWHAALMDARLERNGYDSIIMLEDDIIFARGWLEVLQAMQRGIGVLGHAQGLTTCFRPHESPQSALVDLGGVRAYQSMAHTWHVNMLPIEVLERMDVFEEALAEVEKSKSRHGLDVYYTGLLAHRLSRVSFISEQSWVAHTGTRRSIVKGQGYRECRHCGINPVTELQEMGFTNGSKGV
jgi:hypothetical protein